MIRNLLACGLAAGLIAGLIAAGTATLVGEPAVDQAIAFEDAHSHAAASAPAMDHAHADAAPVPRSLQKTAGLLTALIVYGVSLGGLFALVFAFAYGRVGRLGPQVTTYWLAVGAFVAVYLVPFLKYPANPPSVGDPDTIGRGTALYAVMLGISLLCALAALRLRRGLTKRIGSHNATLVALVAYGVSVVAAGVILPGVHEVPKDFPATTLWQFREGSLAVQLTIWTTIALVFGYASQSVMSRQPVFRRASRFRAAGAEP
jgi:predicted cobalt transporter CbtA